MGAGWVSGINQLPEKVWGFDIYIDIANLNYL